MKLPVRRNAVLLGSAALLAGVAPVIYRRCRSAGLRDKVVLITGGSRGLGIAMAREFARQGTSLALCARSEEELSAAKADE